MKNLALVALAALSLGMGTAMAQEGGQDYQTPYWTLARQADARNVSTVQAGSSDADAVRTGAHVLPFNGDYSDLANPN